MVLAYHDAVSHQRKNRHKLTSPELAERGCTSFFLSEWCESRNIVTLFETVRKARRKTLESAFDGNCFDSLTFVCYLTLTAVHTKQNILLLFSVSIFVFL